MSTGGQAVPVPDLFPRLFVKALPETERPEAVDRQVVMMVADTEVTQTLWGEGVLRLTSSGEDALGELQPGRVLGASYVAGNQVLNWGRVVSEEGQ